MISTHNIFESCSPHFEAFLEPANQSIWIWSMAVLKIAISLLLMDNPPIFLSLMGEITRLKHVKVPLYKHIFLGILKQFWHQFIRQIVVRLTRGQSSRPCWPSTIENFPQIGWAGTCLSAYKSPDMGSSTWIVPCCTIKTKKRLIFCLKYEQGGLIDPEVKGVGFNLHQGSGARVDTRAEMHIAMGNWDERRPFFDINWHCGTVTRDPDVYIIYPYIVLISGYRYKCMFNTIWQTNMDIDNYPFVGDFLFLKWWFSISLFVYQRVSIICVPPCDPSFAAARWCGQRPAR